MMRINLGKQSLSEVTLAMCEYFYELGYNVIASAEGIILEKEFNNDVQTVES